MNADQYDEIYFTDYVGSYRIIWEVVIDSTNRRFGKGTFSLGEDDLPHNFDEMDDEESALTIRAILCLKSYNYLKEAEDFFGERFIPNVSAPFDLHQYTDEMLEDGISVANSNHMVFFKILEEGIIDEPQTYDWQS